jgi:galactokinase
MEVPTATKLSDIYTEDAVEAQRKRWDNLLSAFKTSYGRPAEFVARSPGRVNIIGEVS